jgi:hypothetical protein
MAETASTTSKANTAVKHEGDHDRVAMLSLNADGTPDQHNPEIIGDVETAKAAAREQFKQQAVSAVDVAQTEAEKPEDEGTQDPSIQARVDEHEKVASAAEKAADKTVESLSKS